MKIRLRASQRAAIWAASGAAFAVLTFPAGLIEVAATSSGISEVLPAAAPPLGTTARLLLAGFAGVMAAGAALAFRRQSAPAKGVEKMGFALSRLTGLARRRARKPEPLVSDMPILRRADAHPDAPPRRPIFANSDFGGTGMFSEMPASPEDQTPDIAAPEIEAAFTESLASVDDPVIDAAIQDAACAAEEQPAPLPLDGMSGEEVLSGFAPLAAPVPPPGMEAQPEVPAAAPPREPRPPLDGLTIAQLAERFELGLARRAIARPVAPFDAPPVQIVPVAAQPVPRVIADIPPVPPVAVKPDVDMQVDEALRAALGTLQRMSAR
ncbi:hypothetical protein KFK14_18510 [Sphingobium phenoxybenzoativorans]|uniref:Uncharacterized protein n=1 Tax=Sphingobium phenoxybenzoativorans TaxID=1592790 RepID=A0A975Q0L3_9SPHN|nr:hypothetical protein [Sphingobium phenoxybenzoativorans]QUT04990.1 hypothetical protein KFK14_18510 [Sphingobium phenoxybenzoativorans]